MLIFRPEIYLEFTFSLREPLSLDSCLHSRGMEFVSSLAREDDSGTQSGKLGPGLIIGGDQDCD